MHYHPCIGEPDSPNRQGDNKMITKYDNFRFPTLDLFDSFGLFNEVAYQKRTDVVDNEGIKIEMPGVKQSDLEVTVEGKILKIAGKSRHGKEYSYTYTLRNSVDESSIEARLQDGLLEIKLPKKAESKARKIPITQ